MLISSIAGHMMIIDCTATIPPLVFLTSVTCGYLPLRGNCALAQMLAACPFPIDKSQRNYRGGLLTKSQISVASTHFCQIHQSCEQYDTYSLGLFCNALFLARFRNTPLVERGLRDFHLSFERAYSSIIHIFQRSSYNK
jgi:hypothetical protein